MQTKLNPYISFRDNTREAMEFYKTVFGGKLTTSTYAETGMTQFPDEGDKIGHAMLEVDNGIVIMAADTPNSMPYSSESSVRMSLSGDNEAELTAYFEKLSKGGKLGEPLSKAPWGDTFGMLSDKFGVEWMVNISGAKE